MCFGSQPQQPTIQYSGPSAGDIERANAAVEKYRQDSLLQQKQFAEALQKQIDDANAQMSAKRQELDQEMAAASAAAAAQQQAAYASTTTTSEPVEAQTTTAVTPKVKAAKTMKIAPGATQVATGSGINIGV